MGADKTINIASYIGENIRTCTADFGGTFNSVRKILSINDAVSVSFDKLNENKIYRL